MNQPTATSSRETQPLAPTPHAPAEQELSQASFSQTLREIARRELNWIGVVLGVAEPLPLAKR